MKQSVHEHMLHDFVGGSSDRVTCGFSYYGLREKQR